MTKRKPSPYAPGGTQQKQEQYHAVLEQLRAMTMHSDAPLHPVSKEVIRYVLTVIDICWNQPTTETRDAIVDRMKRMANTMLAQAEYFRHTDPESARYAHDSAECARLTLMSNESNSAENVAAYEAWWKDRHPDGE